MLDGDNVRHGLNKDLSMSDADRAEDIRRVGEVARLMTDAGLVVITAFLSPFCTGRDRAFFDDGDFIEIFVDTPLFVCEQRDPKGLYKKARAGYIKDFTGIGSVYEPPTSPELRVNTEEKSVGQCVNEIVAFLRPRIELSDI
jgi:adenylylsulfate kinase